MKYYAITFSSTTPESVDNGDFSETGFITENTERSEDWKEELQYEIRNYGFYSPSCSPWYPSINIWYSSGYSVEDYGTGEEREYNLHVSGDWTEEELKELWEMIK